MDQTLFLTFAIMIAGLIGCVAPVLPGPPLVWLGALFYGWQTGWEKIGPLFLAITLVVALIGGSADLWMGFLGAKKGGASFGSQIAALVGGVLGFLVLSVPGLLIGSIAAIAFFEWRRHRDWNAVVRAGGGYLAGYLLAIIIEIVAALLILGFFVARLAI
ncbi:hypothetical protein B1R32_11287 [Abditibacterium utsteinense]|uniref:DUF456 domain-containing protein n=1 Tax=Abditibacterium utsteinense TaxID=1960156 RepID=A0A2S8SRI6_9BACT|nr:DUF456 domain-containing protein [Abditibacterium utsteinense]PQV63432.1 hypothetical protein B1R32_11287 [Abditibacterium utsteinense]